jgi:rhomboid protease GluP
MNSDSRLQILYIRQSQTVKFTGSLVKFSHLSQKISMPRYQQSFPLYKDIETSLLVAFQAFTHLGWTPEYAGETAIAASPPAVFKTKDFLVVCRAVNGELVVESEMLNNEVFDLLKKNKKNTSKFIEAFSEAQLTSAHVLHQHKEALATLRQYTAQRAEQEIKDAEEVNTAFNLHNSNLYLTYGIIGINVLLFALMAFNGAGLFEPDGWVHIRWGSNYTPLTLSGDWWRLVSSIFIHFGIIHLLMNMYCLYTIGVYLEPFLGKLRFITAYLCTGVLADIVSLGWHTEDINGAGASGAVFGMYGVFLALLTTKLVPAAIRKSLLQSIGIFVVYNLVYGMKSGVDNAAHAGGLVSGFIIGYAFVPMIQKEKNGQPLKWIPAAIVALTVGITAFYLLQHPVTLKEREAALSIVKDASYRDNDKFNTVLLQFDEQGASEYKILTDSTLTDLSLTEKINQEALPGWQKLEVLFKETARYDISPAAHKKAALLGDYIILQKKELDIIKEIAKQGQTQELIQALNDTRAASDALIKKAVAPTE